MPFHFLPEALPLMFLVLLQDSKDHDKTDILYRSFGKTEFIQYLKIGGEEAVLTD